ncbi:MAG: hypothetical protein Q8N84_01355 [bacterium]|nr:hypothetical protein [bacterium]
MAKKILPLMVLVLAALVLLIVVVANLPQNKTTTTDNSPKDSRLDDPNLLYASFSSSGLCSNGKGEEGGCYTHIFLYRSGKYVDESGWQGRNNKNETMPTVEKQFDQSTMVKIIKHIKDSGIMTKNCPSVQNQDAWFSYQINLDGVKKSFEASPILECQKIFWEIDSLVSSAAKSLLDFVDTLENFPTLTPDEIAKILTVSLVEAPEELSPYYFVREAEGSNIAGFFKSVELRTPTETNKGGLLILDLEDSLGVIEKDILNKYPNAIPELTEATTPTTVPYDWMVKKPWGKISFQITRDGSKRVVAVILDSIN